MLQEFFDWYANKLKGLKTIDIEINIAFLGKIQSFAKEKGIPLDTSILKDIHFK